MENVTLPSGRVVIHTREPNGSTLATPTPGDTAFTRAEHADYQRITAAMKRDGVVVPYLMCWSNYLV